MAENSAEKAKEPQKNAAEQPILEARGLWKEYGDTVVLEKINAKIRKGEFVTVIGTSGCGKSTFLKLRARSYMTVIDLLHNLTYIKNYKNSVI